MKRIVSLLLVLICVCTSLFSSPKKEEKTEGTYKIGICNYVYDASLDQIVENIKSRLDEIQKERNVKFDIRIENCNADMNILNQIIANFISDKVDLMIGIATPVAMTMQGATEDNQIPVIFSAVSDPVGSKIVASLQNPGGNLSGTSDYLDSTSLLNLIFALKPNAKKIGLLYDAGQDSSTTPIKEAKQFLKSRGIEYVERTGTDQNSIVMAAQSLVSDNVDAVFTPTDNTVMTSELAIYEIFSDAKIPHFTGADSFALNGAFLGYGVDYAYLGIKTADMAASVLIDKQNISNLSVMTFDNGTATINTETAEKLGYNINELTKIFIPYCTAVKEIKTANSFNDLK